MQAETVREAYEKVYSPESFMRFYRALADELHLLAHASRAIPISPVPLVLDARFEPVFSGLAGALWEAISDIRYRTLCADGIPRRLLPPDAGDPEPIPFDPKNSIGCIDLHLEGDQPRMIEFMVLPPGMSGIYPGMLARYADYLRGQIPGYDAPCFHAGWDRARCEEVLERQILGSGEVRRVAIIDWERHGQITYGECRYTVERLGETSGTAGLIADPREVAWDGRCIRVRDLPVDRILNRLTLLDWTRHAEEIPDYTRLLWKAPGSFVHHPYLWYLGDKNSLALLSDPEVRSSLDLAEPNRRLLSAVIPPTFRLTRFRGPGGGWDLDRLTAEVGQPSEIVLKPVSSHASKGILFGPVDMPTKKRLEATLASIDAAEYVAMRLVPAPPVHVPRGDGRVETWKCDLRIFVLNGEYVFPGGRVYLGDYTNQVPCRTFAPLFFA